LKRRKVGEETLKVFKLIYSDGFLPLVNENMLLRKNEQKCLIYAEMCNATYVKGILYKLESG
jgi:hypothetical protein